MRKLGKNPIISVIIPVYNVEKYLRKALESAANQTFNNYEVIIINDGSTDKSLDIVLEFVKKYKNFYLVNQKNSGLSKARNIGIEISRGEYIAFLDSDDFIEPDYLETLYNACVKDNADIAYCGHFLYFHKINFKFYMPFTSRTVKLKKDKALKKLIRDITLHYFAWNKLYKKSLFKENNITFSDMYFEDIATTPKLFYYANKVSITSKALYNYTKRTGSILRSMNVKKINDYIRAYGCIRNFLEKNNDFEEYSKSFKMFGYRMMLCNYYSVFRIHILYKNFNGFIKNIKNSNNSVKYYKSKEFEIFDGEPILPCPITEPECKSKKNVLERDSN